ncbi:hypothetical protein chiPu_0030912, partial [Chiloscyllium punctatum]|nr:hypothetical protein [Chiloscyllium punctatum]
ELAHGSPVAHCLALPFGLARARPGTRPLSTSRSFGQTDAGLGKGHEARQRLDPAQERVDVRIGGEIDIAFRRARQIAVECDVGDGRLRANQPVAIGEMSLEPLQHHMGARDHVVRIELRAEHGDEPRRGGTKGEIAGGDREPALHRRGALRILGQPVGAAELGREVDQDRVGIRDDRAVVVKHRHLAERIERQEFRRLVCSGPEVDLDQLMRNSEQGDEQAGAMCVTGEREV